MAYPYYVLLVDLSWHPKWVKFVVKYSWVLVTLVQILQLSLGTWSLVQHGLKFIWSTPVSLHFTMFIVCIVFLIQSKSFKVAKRWYILRFVFAMIVNLVAVVVSVVGRVNGWEAEHLIQCLLCMVVVLEYFVGKPLVGAFEKRHNMKHGVPLTSLDPCPEGRRATGDSC